MDTVQQGLNPQPVPEWSCMETNTVFFINIGVVNLQFINFGVIDPFLSIEWTTICTKFQVCFKFGVADYQYLISYKLEGPVDSCYC